MKRTSNVAAGTALQTACGVVMALGAAGHSRLTGPRVRMVLLGARVAAGLRLARR